MPYMSTGWLFWAPKRRPTAHYATECKVSTVISLVWLADYFSLSLFDACVDDSRVNFGGRPQCTVLCKAHERLLSPVSNNGGGGENDGIDDERVAQVLGLRPSSSGARCGTVNSQRRL